MTTLDETFQRQEEFNLAVKAKDWQRALELANSSYQVSNTMNPTSLLLENQIIGKRRQEAMYRDLVTAMGSEISTLTQERNRYKEFHDQWEEAISRLQEYSSENLGRNRVPDKSE